MQFNCNVRYIFFLFNSSYWSDKQVELQVFTDFHEAEKNRQKKIRLKVRKCEIEPQMLIMWKYFVLSLQHRLEKKIRSTFDLQRKRDTVKGETFKWYCSYLSAIATAVRLRLTKCQINTTLTNTHHVTSNFTNAKECGYTFTWTVFLIHSVTLSPARLWWDFFLLNGKMMNCLIERHTFYMFKLYHRP